MEQSQLPLGGTELGPAPELGSDHCGGDLARKGRVPEDVFI